MAGYRAYVGPAEDYDRIAAITFNLLTTLGLRGRHTLLDVGCGSLRIGRLLIPYLDVGKYTGIEPHARLLREGIEGELGQDILEVKAPRFYIDDTAKELPFAMRYHYVLAQSIFSHTGLPLLRGWLAELSRRLYPEGVLAATYCPGPEDYPGDDWVYPGTVTYRPETLAACAQEAGLGFHRLGWPHPRQEWVLFTGSQYSVPEGLTQADPRPSRTWPG
jgi:SAM-dependent methyltransferase